MSVHVQYSLIRFLCRNKQHTDHNIWSHNNLTTSEKAAVAPLRRNIYHGRTLSSLCLYPQLRLWNPSWIENLPSIKFITSKIPHLPNHGDAFGCKCFFSVSFLQNDAQKCAILLRTTVRLHRVVTPHKVKSRRKPFKWAKEGIKLWSRYGTRAGTNSS